MNLNIGKFRMNQKKLIMKNKLFYILSCVFVLCTASVNAQSNYKKTGVASFYADKFEGRQTANGEIYYHAKKTAAHNTLPFGSVVKVTNLENNKFVIVRINDRGPFIDNRIIDLSKSAARDLGFVELGLTNVRIELIASTEDLPDNNPKVEKSTKTEVYYKLNVETVSPTGKGVQVASYNNDENVYRLAEMLTKKYNEDVFIEIVTLNKQKLYRVIVGNYNSDSQLNSLKEKLSKEFPGCFIVTFKN